MFGELNWAGNVQDLVKRSKYKKENVELLIEDAYTRGLRDGTRYALRRVIEEVQKID